MVYSAKVSSAKRIDMKTGRATLLDFDVNVGGYRDRERIERAKSSYNMREEPIRERVYKSGDWRPQQWDDLFYKMVRIHPKKKKRKFIYRSRRS